jgi:SAM-dependent methyltransferase
MSDSLDAGYFDGIFQNDDDPWGLATSAYEDAKFTRTIAALDDRRYAHAFEVGCAHGVLTERLAPLCDALLAVDISAAAIAKARVRLAAHPQAAFQRMAFPREAPSPGDFDLIMLSEVVYYWSDTDIALAAARIDQALAKQGRIILVHWIGETDYPQTGDDAVAKLWAALADSLAIETTERTDAYRLDLWTRR